MSIRIGRFVERVTIERVTETRSSIGEVEQKWSPLITVNAEIKDLSEAEKAAINRDLTVDNKYIITRWVDSLTVKDRVSYNDITYSIISITEIGRARKSFIQLLIERKL